MSPAIDSAKKLWTETDLVGLPDDGFTYELVGGELVMSPKNNWLHGRICTRLLVAIANFATAHRLGAVLDSSTGFWMANRNCRAPNVSFVSKARLAAIGFHPNEKKFFPGAPDLAVEVLSESNTRTQIDERLKDFFASGTQIAWVIDPERQRVEVCHSATGRKMVGFDGLLNGEALLPGFQYPVENLFKEWDWD